MAHQNAATGTLDVRPLLFEAFVCSLAMMSFVAVLGPIARTLGFVPWQAGAVMTAGGLSLALFARWWGSLSDRWGRRRVLLLALGGFASGHLAMSGFLGFSLQHTLPAGVAFWGLLLLRAISGMFYAAVPATGAALIADHVAPGLRTQSLASLGAASALGLITGPGLTALLVGQGLTLPIALPAALPFFALLILWWKLPRSGAIRQAPGTRPPFNDRRLRLPVTVAFASMLCVSIAQVTVGFYALDRLRLDAAAAGQTAGIALTGVGLALVLAQLLLRTMAWPARRWIIAGALVSALGFGSVAWANNAIGLWLGYFVAAFGMGWVFPSVAGLAADAVQAGEQGAAAGAVAGAHGWGMIIGPVLGTLIYSLHTSSPYVFMAAAMLGVALWLCHSSS